MGAIGPDDAEVRGAGIAGGRSRPARRSVLHAAREPVVVGIFALAGLFELLSGDPVVHASVLFAIAAALAWDAGRRRQGRPGALPGAGGEVAVPHVRVSPPVVLIGLAYAFAMGTFARFSWPSTAAVVAPGAAGVVIAWRTPSNEEPEPAILDPAGTAAWLAVFLALALWELAALLLQPSLKTPSAAHPTVSTLMDPVLASHIGRSITMALWLALGWYLVER